MTSSRHDQAAARSTPYGTSARLKFEVPAAISTGASSCSRSCRRIAAHWWASREATPSLCSGASSLDVVATRRGTAVVAHAVNLSTTHPAGSSPGGTPRRGAPRPAARRRRARSRSRPRPGRARGAASRRRAPMLGPRTRSATPVAAVPQHPAGADHEIDLAQVDAGALDHPAFRADHHLRAAGVPTQGQGHRGAGDRLVLVALPVGGGEEAGVLAPGSGRVLELRAARPRRRSRPRTSACRGRPRPCG